MIGIFHIGVTLGISVVKGLPEVHLSREVRLGALVHAPRL